jgi:transcription antitermination protein NusB
MSRRTSRQEVFKLLFQIAFQKISAKEILDNFYLEAKDIDEKDKEYIDNVIMGTIENLESIDDLINKHSIGWDVKRISNVGRTVMRIAIFEMLYREDIPASVSINEAVELAKIYEGTDCASFVNGILGTIQKQIKN